MSDSPSPFQHAASYGHHLTSGDSTPIPFSRPGTPTRRDAHQVGFLGLGAMGHFMARNLALNPQAHPAGSPPVLVYNRTVSKSEALVKEVGEQRARIAQSPAELVRESDIIVTNLASDEVVRKIYQEFAAELHVSRLLN
jgi:ketol-acid reductoisomerase